jgi:mRNA interferase MazF
MEKFRIETFGSVNNSPEPGNTILQVQKKRNEGPEAALCIPGPEPVPWGGTGWHGLGGGMRRGDVYYADLRPVIGSEQGGIRPVLIIQNDVGNRHSPTVICAAITSKMNKAKLPTHIELNASLYDMDKDSVVLLEQLRTIDKKRLKDKVCHLDGEIMRKVNRALMVSLELDT